MHILCYTLLETINKEYSLAFHKGGHPMKKALVVLSSLTLGYLIFYIYEVKQFRKHHFSGAYKAISDILKHRRWIKVER